MIIDDREVVTVVPFLDYHRSRCAPTKSAASSANTPYAPWVVQDIVDCRERPVIAGGLQLSPYIDWSPFTSFDDYLASVNAHHVGRLREEEAPGEAEGSPKD